MLLKHNRVTGNIHQLRFLGFFSNCYLVREEDGFTLVDTSTSGAGKAIVQAAKECGGEIKRILLTHAHSDHMGSLDELHDLLGNVPVAISEREAPLLRKDLSLRPDEPQIPLKPSVFPGAKTRPTHTLTEGELFGSLRCIYTPGHTPGQMSFLDERDSTLLSGDALISFGGTLNVVTTPPWYFPFPALFTWDKGLANASAKKLLSASPKVILNGHGPAVQDGIQALSEAIRFSANSRLRFLTILG